jgi:acyl-CoA dehydrogenase
MTWSFSTEPEFEAKLEWARQFLAAEVEPLEALDLDRPRMEKAIAPLREQVKEQGLWAAHLDPELGGPGYGQLKLGLLNEIVGRSMLGPEVFSSQAPDAGNTEILAINGTEIQKQRYLQPLLDGTGHSAFAMTELDRAGADPTLMAVQAKPQGEGYLLDGTKWFISGADIADFFLVMAVTDPEAEPHKRASVVIVERDDPGLVIEREIGSMHEPHVQPGSPFTHSVVRFEGVELGADRLLGEEGGGFKIAQQRLGPGRIHHCMRWIGQANRAFEMMCERARYREAHGGPLERHQTIQNWIADSAAQIHAARLMTLHAAWRIDLEGSRAARREIAMIKYFGAQVMLDTIDRAIQVHGSLGYSTDLPLESMYRWGRASRLYDGPDEVHRATVAKLVLREFEAPADGVPSEYVPARREAALQRYAELLDLSSV